MTESMSNNARRLLKEICLTYGRGKKLEPILAGYPAAVLSDALDLLCGITEVVRTTSPHSSHLQLGKEIRHTLDRFYIAEEAGLGKEVVPEITYKDGHKGGENGVRQRHAKSKSLHHYEDWSDTPPNIRDALEKKGWRSPAFLAKHIEDVTGKPTQLSRLEGMVRAMTKIMRQQKIDELSAGQLQQQHDPARAAEERVQSSYIYRDNNGAYTYHLLSPEAIKDMEQWLATGTWTSPPPLGNGRELGDLCMDLRKEGVKNPDRALEYIRQFLLKKLSLHKSETEARTLIVHYCFEPRSIPRRKPCVAISSEAEQIVTTHLKGQHDPSPPQEGYGYSQRCHAAADALCDMILAREQSVPLNDLAAHDPQAKAAWTNRQLACKNFPPDMAL